MRHKNSVHKVSVILDAMNMRVSMLAAFLLPLLYVCRAAEIILMGGSMDDNNNVWDIVISQAVSWKYTKIPGSLKRTIITLIFNNFSPEPGIMVYFRYI